MSAEADGVLAGAAPDARSRVLLVFCAVAVMFAAIDTYVVVLALPDMMASTGIPLDELQRAAPIISGFLLGYVAMLPLIGRIADLRGPVPVLAVSLTTFALGSLVTAASYDLGSLVAGRFLQGVGGGGLVPATMALVARIYPVERRGLPLGLVSAVQEFGAVLGPLFGAAVLSFTSWRGIFALNLAGGLVLLAAVRALAGDDVALPRPGRRAGGLPDLLGLLALLVALAAGTLTFLQPPSLLRDLTLGQVFIPFVDGGGRWLTPVGAVAIAAALVFVVRSFTARRPLFDARTWGRSLVEADLVGALALGVALAGIVLAFATAEPEVSLISAQGPWFLLASLVALALFVSHLRRAEAPLVPRGALTARPAWGSLVVSLLVGWSLIAALVDIPLFARTTVYESQLGAALVLLRFLVALPIGAIVGGYLVRLLPAGVIAGAGMLLTSGGFWWMSTWGATSLDDLVSTVPLVLGGLGFGIALAPVNAAVLAATSASVHGIASAGVVVARMVGMLVGISVLTTLGLQRLYAARDDDPSLGVRELSILQEQAVFQGAAVVALLAALLAVVLLRGAATRGIASGELLRAAG